MTIRQDTRRLLIAGHYGHGNLGDEAVLEGILAGLRGVRPAVEVTVVSANPEVTAEVYSVRAIHERNRVALVDAAGVADLLLIGGGGPFRDDPGLDDDSMCNRLPWGLPLHLALAALVALKRRPFMIYAVGLAPFSTPASKLYTRLAFERASRATVRDAASLELAASIGIDTARVETTADPAFLVTTAPHRDVRALLEQVAVPAAGTRLIAVSVHHSDCNPDPSEWQRRLAIALDQLVAEERATVLFVPFQHGAEGNLTGDRAVAEGVRNGMRRQDATRIFDRPLNPGEVQGIFAAADLVVATHLHGVILALNACTPIVTGIAGADVRDVMQQVGLQKYALDLATAEAGVIADGAREALNARDRIRSGLGKATTALRMAADRNRSVLQDLLACPEADLPLSAEWWSLLDDLLWSEMRRSAADALRIDALEAEVKRRSGEREQLARAHASASHMLAERTAELNVLAAELARVTRDLEWRPVHSAGRLRRAGRRGLVHAWRLSTRAVATIIGRPLRLLAAAYEAVVPKPAQGALRRALIRRLMSWPAYAFDRYKRQRVALYGLDLQGLHSPGPRGLVSVVLPIYNGAGLMREAIDSVLGQTYADLELIIVDDGSVDETPAIADAYARADRRVRVVRQANAKLPAALSQGFRLARGEYLTWTSADNRLKPDCLDKMVHCLSRHPDWDMAYGNLDMIGADGQPLRNTTYWDGRQVPPGSEHVHVVATTGQLNVVPNNHVGASLLYRRRVAELIGDYSRRRFVLEDYDYWMRVNALMTLRHTDFTDPVTDYRFHQASLSARWNELDMFRHRDRLMVFDDFRRDFYLMPMVWILDGDAGEEENVLRGCLSAAGHLSYDGTYPLGALPRSGLPTVYAHLTSDPEHAVVGREDLPAGTLRVLVATSGALPTAVSGAWDLCCAWGVRPSLPLLTGASRGWLAAADAQTLFQAVDIRAKSAELERMEERAENSEAPSLDASVVISTMAPSERLQRAVRSVAEQTFDPARYELIVVSNTVADRELESTIEVLRTTAFAGRPDRLRFVVCPVRGLSAARNAGLAEARGEIVCFLDDDAVAAENWLAATIDAFATHPLAGVVGGHIVLEAPTPAPQALRRGWEKYWSQFVTDYRAYAEVGDWRQFPWGANWSARRIALRQIGGFRTRYGRTGDNFGGGEELVAACLIQRLGYTIGIEPRSVVTHDVVPQRFTFDHVRRTMDAGIQVGYRAKRDLYLPHGAGGVMAALGDLFTHHFDRTVEAGRYRWVDAYYRKAAQLRRIATALGDIANRARSPIVGNRS
jgi:polysaccharide pyruvyl transferase CsaB